jgi:hypothetical protein
MKKENQIRLFMMQNVFGNATSNQATTDLIKAFRDGIITEGNIINQITALSGNQGNTISVGGAKEMGRTLLDGITANILKQARGYCLSVNNLDLAAQFNYSPTRIAKISDKNIVERAQNWYNLVAGILSNLNPWDVTDQTMNNWQSAIDNYIAVYKLPKNKKDLRKQKTAQINSLIKMGMDHCRNVLDNAAIGFLSNGNIEFYNQFKIKRKLDAVASKTGKFRVLVTDELNQPIPNVTITQDGTTNKITTGIDGFASLDIIYNTNKDPNQMDLYSFTLRSGNKTISTGIIEIKHNQTVSRTYIMAPSGFIIPAHQPAVVPVNA